ncbi:MAG: hypothetical protein NT127_05740 [Sphingobacteriales bacterium]|nr:hypothetical protein [Sphingobacteriales bacterium]
MNNLSKNPAFMKRMENAVEFKPNMASETTSNYWPVIVQLLVVAGGAYCLYKMTEPRKIIINHYHLPKPLSGDVSPVTESKNNTQNTGA